MVIHGRCTTIDMTLRPEAHSLKSIFKCDGASTTSFICCYQNVCCSRSVGIWTK